MPDEVCPLCEGQGSGLPGYFGTMADMFTLLFAFFVLMFSMATMDPAQMPGDGGVEGEGSAEEQKKIEEKVEALEKETQVLKEMGITEIEGQPIQEYMDSLIQDTKEQSEPPPKKYEIHGDLAEIIEEMELDSSEANVDLKDVRGIVIELNGSICFDPGKATLKPKLLKFLDAAVDSFMTVPRDNNQIIIEGHSDNTPITNKKIAEIYPSNWELSSARAAAVVKYLINKGVNPSRLVAHGYADRWPSDMMWADMRRGHQLKPVGENVEVVTGRGGQPEYRGVELDENNIPIFDKISMDTIIDSLNATPELRAKNRRIKIIFTRQQFVDGLDMKPVEDVGRK